VAKKSAEGQKSLPKIPQYDHRFLFEGGKNPHSGRGNASPSGRRKGNFERENFALHHPQIFTPKRAHPSFGWDPML
jgi:hypothetical protein